MQSVMWEDDEADTSGGTTASAPPLPSMKSPEGIFLDREQPGGALLHEPCQYREMEIA